MPSGLLSSSVECLITKRSKSLTVNKIFDFAGLNTNTNHLTKLDFVGLIMPELIRLPQFTLLHYTELYFTSRNQTIVWLPNTIIELISQMFDYQRTQTNTESSTALMSRIERKHCLISTSYFSGLFDIFILLHI